MNELTGNVIEAGRMIVEKGLTWGTSGNISIRRQDRIWITASGTRIGALTEEDILVCDLDGRVVAGTKKPSKETGMHLAMYRERPDAEGIVHCSPFYTTLCACSDIELKTNLFIESMYYDREVERIPYFHAGSAELAKAAAAAAGQANVILMANHGILTLDTSLAEAVTAVEITEQMCRMNVLAAMGGFGLKQTDSSTVEEFLTGGYYKKVKR